MSILNNRRKTMRLVEKREEGAMYQKQLLDVRETIQRENQT